VVGALNLSPQAQTKRSDSRNAHFVARFFSIKRSARTTLACVLLFLALLESLEVEGAAFLGYEAIDSARPTFLAVGDTQRTSNWEFWRERNFETTQKLLREMARRKPAFVLHLGDLTARGSSRKHWEYFDKWSKPLREAAIPVCPVLGNHEYYGRNNTALSNFHARFPYLHNRTWYSFSWRGVLFICLNGNFGDLEEKERAEQLTFYQGRLKQAEADPSCRFVAVCCHHPPYSNGKVVSPSAEVERLFAKPFEAFPKPGLFLSGHCHSYEHFFRSGKHFIVSGGGGGPRHKLNINPKTRRYNDLFKGPAKRFFHFLQITYRKEGLLVEVIAFEKKKNSFARVDSFLVRCK